MRRESLHEGFNLDVRLQTEAAIDHQRQEIEIHDLAARVCYRDR